MRPRQWIVDLVAAVILVAVVFIFEPGVAIGLLVALVLLIVCLLSVLVERWRMRQARFRRHQAHLRRYPRR